MCFISKSDFNRSSFKTSKFFFPKLKKNKFNCRGKCVSIESAIHYFSSLLDLEEDSLMLKDIEQALRCAFLPNKNIFSSKTFILHLKYRNISVSSESNNQWDVSNQILTVKVITFVSI